jgi:hypothetical protein
VSEAATTPLSASTWINVPAQSKQYTNPRPSAASASTPAKRVEEEGSPAGAAEAAPAIESNRTKGDERMEYETPLRSCSCDVNPRAGNFTESRELQDSA